MTTPSATNPQKHTGGRYFEDCGEAPILTRRSTDYTGVAWYARYALNPGNAERLRDTALGLLDE